MDFPSKRIRCLDMPFSKNKWLRVGIIVAIFNALISLFMTPLNRWGVNFASMMVHSQCIGFSIFGIYRILAVTLFARQNSQQKYDYLRQAVSMILAAPTGYILGMAIAATLLREHELTAELRQTTPVIMGFTFAATGTIAYFFWSSRRLSEETAAHARAQRLAAEAQLKLLQTQIEPHMLFNTLSTLHTLIDIDPPRAQAMVDQLITYLRSTLAASRAEQITLHNEFEQLRAYLQLMSLRMGTRLTFKLELPDNLQTTTVPPMLLQPLVENAIKHGLEPKIDGGCITVRASLAPGKLVLEVHDTGLGLSGNALSDGYGLSNVRERLSALYGTHATLKIDSTLTQGLAVLITLPHANS